jgi:hypothetical protein
MVLRQLQIWSINSKSGVLAMTQNSLIAKAIDPITPDKRSDPAVRRRMSGPALRSFFNIAARWRLSTADQRALLGWPPESTFFSYKKGSIGTLAYDTLLRISVVLGIFKDLHILCPEPKLADSWVHLPNTNQLFRGTTPIAFMAKGGIDAMWRVRRLLDARRGGWN